MGIIEDDRRLQIIVQGLTEMGAGAMVRQMIDAKLLNLIQQYHDKKITILGGSSRYAGWYQTYFGSGNDRKQRRFRTLQELYEYCVYYYGRRSETLETLFPQWLKWKGDRNGNKAGTLESNRIAYDKYVRGTSLERIPITDITAENLDDWARELLIRKPLNAVVRQIKRGTALQIV